MQLRIRILLGWMLLRGQNPCYGFLLGAESIHSVSRKPMVNVSLYCRWVAIPHLLEALYHSLSCDSPFSSYPRDFWGLILWSSISCHSWIHYWKLCEEQMGPEQTLALLKQKQVQKRQGQEKERVFLQQQFTPGSPPARPPTTDRDIQLWL